MNKTVSLALLAAGIVLTLFGFGESLSRRGAESLDPNCYGGRVV